MDEAILNSWCDFMIQSIHPSLNIPPIFIYNNFLCTGPLVSLPPLLIPPMKEVQILAQAYTPLSCTPSILYAPGSNPLLQRVWLMENRPGGGGGGVDMLLLWPGSNQQWQQGGSCIFLLQYNPSPLFTSRGREWRKKSWTSCGVLQAQKIIKIKNMGCKLNFDLHRSNTSLRLKGMKIIKKCETFWQSLTFCSHIFN